MAEIDFTNIAATSINTPASGVTAVYADSVNKIIKCKDDTGFVTGQLTNFSTASQAPTATTRTYITGSKITVPKSKIQIGTIFRWRFSATKTAAGTASSTIDIAVGTAGTTADTARVSFTKPAGTAAVDEAWFEVHCISRGPLSASGIFAGQMIMTHNLSATGHATIPVVVVNTISSAFDVTVADLFVGLCITTGASDAITIQMVTAEAVNL
jgi:hypothetical protein